MDKRYSVTIHSDSFAQVETLLRLNDFLLDDDENVAITVTPDLMASIEWILNILTYHIKQGHWDLDDRTIESAHLLTRNCSRLADVIRGQLGSTEE